MTFFNANDWGGTVLFFMGLPGWIVGSCMCLFISLMGFVRFTEAIWHLGSKPLMIFLLLLGVYWSLGISYSLLSSNHVPIPTSIPSDPTKQ